MTTGSQANMKGKVVLITGGNSGIGKATAIGLAKMGAAVVILARNKARGLEAVEDIKKQSGNPNIELLVGDLSLQKSVRRAAAEFIKKHKRLDVLINNGGVFIPNRTETAEGIETTFATNYLSHFLLTHLLLDLLKKSAPSRIINVASLHQGVHLDFDDLMLKKSYSVMKAVGPTKLGLVLFTKTLAKKLEGTGVTVNSLHPGLTNSNLLNNVNPFLRFFMHLISSSPEKGARTSIFLASSPAVEGVTGEFFNNRKIAKTVDQANDVQAEKKLWDESLKLTHISRY
jgi:NAD(P)-dependent dehydrogenase (short-subunit alcohol dehydrogenase family)